MLDAKLSRARQSRLLNVLHERNLDAAVIGLPHHVYYFSTHLARPNHSPAFVLFSDGTAWLTSANSPYKSDAIDQSNSFPANANGTLRQDQPATIATQIRTELLARRAKRIGFDASMHASQLLLEFREYAEAIDPILWQMRRPKDADELALMKKAIEACIAMYTRAREIIEPGTQELFVFNELSSAAVRTLGEPMSALLGNDFACGVGGGSPRKDKKAEKGQLYILDLGPAYRGYFSDNSRVFSIDRNPTDVQLKSAAAIQDVFKMIETNAKPGARCRELFAKANDILQKQTTRGLIHHLGHGVGLQAHEYPHLNAAEIWDDVLVEGEIFTVEPGLYGDDLAGGMRIENQYLVTRTGVENLVQYPTSLL